jgi:hypothetical protein
VFGMCVKDLQCELAQRLRCAMGALQVGRSHLDCSACGFGQHCGWLVIGVARGCWDENGHSIPALGGLPVCSSCIMQSGSL